MSANAVVSGTYSDFKLVKTRSVFQMVIEGPIERAAEAIAMFGVPQPGQEIPVAVALLNPDAAASVKAPDMSARSEQGKERYHQSDAMQKAVVRASLLCRSWRYQDWVGCTDAETAAIQMRQRLGIKSRSEIASNETAFRKFLALETEYRISTGQMAEPR